MKFWAFAVAVAVVVFAGIAGSAGATTIKVNTLEDGFDEDGKCALREAVEASRKNKKEDGCAKGQTKRDVIELKGKIYPLIFITSNEDSNVNGDLDFTGGGPVSVVGKGKGKTEILQNSSDRVIDVQDGGKVTLSKLRLGNGNVAGLGASEGRGGNARVRGGSLTISKSEVSSSDAVVGGGVYADGGAKLKLKRSVMDGTDATVAGGAVGVQSDATATLQRVTVSNTNAISSTEAVRGGVVASDGGDVRVVESTLQASSATASGANDGASGGAIYSNGDLLVNRSLIQGNNTDADDDNIAEHGGGIHAASGDARIVNSTIFNNEAGGPGANDGLGGGLYVGAADVIVDHTTFDSNDGSSAGDAIGHTGGSVGIFGSLIDDSVDPCFGTVSSLGFNVSEEEDPQGDCGFIASDLRDVSTGTVGGLPTDNGGPTLTVAIIATSLARDRVPANLCKEATDKVDQRGFVRPKGDACDAGAFEFNAKP